MESAGLGARGIHTPYSHPAWRRPAPPFNNARLVTLCCNAPTPRLLQVEGTAQSSVAETRELELEAKLLKVDGEKNALAQEASDLAAQVEQLEDDLRISQAEKEARARPPPFTHTPCPSHLPRIISQAEKEARARPRALHTSSRRYPPPGSRQ